MNLESGRELLKTYNASCIILKNNEIIYISKDRGVKPLLEFLNKNIPVSKGDRLILVDKLIGRAALLLAIKGGISEVYTPIISNLALEIAKIYNITWDAEKTVPYIINREASGMCPMENSVKGVIDLDTAYNNIKTRLAELIKNKTP